MAGQPAQPAAQSACKITPIGLGRFRANANTQLDCLLSTPDNLTQLLNVSVFPNGGATPVAGQPTNKTNTTFSLNLPAGNYSVVIVVGFAQGAKAVDIVESCTGRTELDFIAVPAANNGSFSLQVV